MEKDLTDYFRIITQASYSKVENKLKKYGLVKGQAQLLLLIRDNEGCTQKDLANILNVKYSSMSERLNKLEALGYIEKDTDKDNLKYKRIYITSAGKTAAIQCRRIQHDFFENLYDGFSQKDLKAFNKYLEKLCSNIINNQ